MVLEIVTDLGLCCACSESFNVLKPTTDRCMGSEIPQGNIQWPRPSSMKLNIHQNRMVAIQVQCLVADEQVLVS